MERQCKPVCVFLKDDRRVCIQQDYGIDEPAVINVMIEQIPLLIQWLQEAAREAASIASEDASKGDL